MRDVADTDELEAPATADDVYVTLRQLEHFARHDAAAQQRFRRVARLLTPIAERLLKPKYVFTVEPDGQYLIGLLDEARLYSGAPRGVELAHRILAAERTFIPYGDIGEGGKGAASMALNRGRAWLAGRCPPLARVLEAIICGERGIRFDPRDVDVDILTRV